MNVRIYLQADVLSTGHESSRGEASEPNAAPGVLSKLSKCHQLILHWSIQIYLLVSDI